MVSDIELEILEAMDYGESYTYIDLADKLGMSRQLVRYHVSGKKNSLRKRGLVRVRSSSTLKYEGKGGRRTFSEFEITDKGLQGL